jgi:hypothetical protein
LIERDARYAEIIKHRVRDSSAATGGAERRQ